MTPAQAFAREKHLQTAAQLVRQQQFADAARIYEGLLKLNPRDPAGLSEFASLRFREGRFEEAVELGGRALLQAPRSAKLLNNLGVALAGLGRFREASQHYARALAIEPGAAEIWTNLGGARLALHEAAPAISAFESAIAADPDHIGAYIGLGEAFQALGRREDAHRAFTAGLERAPRHTLLHRRLAECRRYGPGDPHLAAMESLAEEQPPLTLPQQVHLRAALAKAYAELGEADRAFQQVLEGNRLQRLQFTYREAETLDLLKRIEAGFTRQLMAEKQGLGNPSDQPIFIVGMPRSGSTLVEQILASHPKVFGAGEIRNFNTAIGALRRGRFESPEFLDHLDSLGRKEFHRLGSAYLSSIDGVTAGAERVTNKLLGNFLYVGLIHLALPNARIVHVRRDAIDTCLSRFSMLLVPGQPYSYELGELGRYHLAYEALMAHWRSALPAGVMLEIDYEDIVADLEGEARRLLQYCGLEWDDACLDFHKTERLVTTPSKSQVRQPLYSGAVGRWRRHEAQLKPLLEALGRGSTSA